MPDPCMCLPPVAAVMKVKNMAFDYVNKKIRFNFNVAKEVVANTSTRKCSARWLVKHCSLSVAGHA